MKEFTYVITDQEGLHARPAGLLVKCAAQFQSAVSLKKGEKTIDAKRLFAVMSLAVKQNEKVTVCVDGSDEEEAVKALKAFFQQNF